MRNSPDYPAILAELRSRAGISQERLAKDLGASLPTVNRWERGRTAPDPALREALVNLIRRWGAEHEDLLRALDGEAIELPPVSKEPSRPGRRGGRKVRAQAPESEGAAYGENGKVMDTRSMEGLLWKAACSIRGRARRTMPRRY